MKRRTLVQDGQPSLELIEEAFSLLRSLSATDWLAYLAGMLPWTLGLLYFWTDFSASPFAERHLIPACVALSGLFFVAKLSQSFLGDRLQSLARGSGPAPWGPRRLMRTLFLHTLVQPSGLFLLPVSALLTLPLGWVVAFYQSATLFASSEDPATPAGVLGRAARQARLWPLQNHGALGLLFLLALFLFLNFLALSFGIPQLLKMLLGIETVFTQSPWITLNSTMLFTLLALTGLCLDPLVKAVYVLRIFHGDSLHTGEDLRAALRRCQAPRGAAVALAIACLLALLPGRSPGASTGRPGSVAASGISAEELDRSIDRTLSRPDYEWRLPRDAAREEVASDGKGWAGFWDRVEKQIKPIFDWLSSTASDLMNRVRNWFGNKSPAQPARVQFDWMSPAEFLFYLAIAVICAALGVLLVRWWRTRDSLGNAALPVAAVPSTPDLREEQVLATQLPEEGWLQLGAELLARGETRLAMRAYFLSSLAHLASRNLITVARFKSNRDYLGELARRAHALPTVRSLFDENLTAFERVWYGSHPAVGPEVEAFATRVRRIQSGGVA